jgi:hypothetical protein
VDFQFLEGAELLTALLLHLMQLGLEFDLIVALGLFNLELEVLYLLHEGQFAKGHQLLELFRQALLVDLL